jgi:hypothetical protein
MSSEDEQVIRGKKKKQQQQQNVYVVQFKYHVMKAGKRGIAKNCQVCPELADIPGCTFVRNRKIT